MTTTYDGGYPSTRDTGRIRERAGEAVAFMRDDPPGTLEEVAREEVAALWTDLERAREYAIDGRWSIACDWIVQRIARLSRLVGPADWQAMPMSLVLDGTFVAVSDAIGVPYAQPTDDDLAHCRALIARNTVG